MLEQAVRPRLKMPTVPAPKRRPPGPVRRPILAKSARKKNRKACPACEEEGTLCPECQKEAAPTLERPPTRTQTRRGSPGEDPAERQADELGKNIGEELEGTGSVGHGPLPKSVREVAEAHLGVSLEGTHIDAGSAGQRKAKDESALAVTEGKRIAFGEGQLDTSSSAGRALLGHELVHVAQQLGSRKATQRQVPLTTKLPADYASRVLHRYGSYMKRVVMGVAPPDVARLLKPFSLHRANEGPTAVRTVPIQSGGTIEKHQIMLQLIWTSQGANSFTVRTGDNIRVSIGVDPRQILPPRGIKAKAGSDPHRQQAYLLAGTLYHELIHVAVRVRKRLDELHVPMTASDATAFRIMSVLAVTHLAASKPGYRQLAHRVDRIVRRMGDLCLALPNCGLKLADIDKRVRRAFDFLVEEWAVNTMSVAGVGVATHLPTVSPQAATPAKGSSAAVYADILFYQLLGHARYERHRGADLVGRLKGELEQVIWRLFDKLNHDADALRAMR